LAVSAYTYPFVMAGRVERLLQRKRGYNPPQLPCC